MTHTLFPLLAVALSLLTASVSSTVIHIHTSVATSAPSPSPTTPVLTGQVVGSSIPISNATLTSCVETRWTFSQPDAPFVSVHFTRFNVVAGDVVTIATPDGAIAKRVTAPSGGAVAFSSPRVPGPTAVVSFTPVGCLAATAFAPLPQAFGFDIDALDYFFKTSYAYVGDSGTESRQICGAANQNKAAVCFKNAANVSSQVYVKARAVARLLKRTTACSGFLLGSEGHFVTNYHCIQSAADADATTFEFMVQAPSCTDGTCLRIGQCADEGQLVSTGADFVFASETLDYAVVKLRCKPCLVNGKYGFLSLRRKAPVKGEPIYVVQHPSGGGKMITMQQDIVDIDNDEDEDDENDGGDDDDKEDDDDSGKKKTGGGLEQAVVAEVNDENSFGNFWTSYYADTEGGSSGSPVLSLTDHTVLALHANGACKNSGAPSHLLVADMEKNKLALPADAFA